MLKHNYIFAPTGELWPASSVNARIPPIIGRERRASRDPASVWLDKNQAGRTNDLGTRRADDDPRPAHLRWRLDRAPERHRLQLYRPSLRWATPATPGLGSTTSTRSTRARRSHHSNGSPTACSVRRRRSTTRSCSAACRASARTPARAGQARGRAVELQGSVARSNCSAASTASSSPSSCASAKRATSATSNRFAFYDHMKAYTAAPPDVLRVDEKNLREYPSRTAAASSSPPTTRPTASPARRRSPPLCRLVGPDQGRLRGRATGPSSGAGTTSGGDRHVAAYLA